MPISPTRRADDPRSADLHGRAARGADGRARGPPRTSLDRRALAARAIALLAGPRDRGAQCRAGVHDRGRRSPAWRPSSAPRLACVPRRVRIPGLACARDAGCPARQAESRLRDRHSDRARDRSGFAAESALDRDWVRPVLLQNLLFAAFAIWLVVSLTLLPEIDDSAIPGRMSWPFDVLSAVGVALYAFAVVRYLALWREPRLRPDSRPGSRLHPAR